MLSPEAQVERGFLRLDDLSGRLSLALRQAVQSKRLATIIRDVPIGMDIDECRYTGPDYEKLRDLFRELDKGRMKQLMAEPNIVDGRNIYEPVEMRSLGFNYVGVGRG